MALQFYLRADNSASLGRSITFSLEPLTILCAKEHLYQNYLMMIIITIDSYSHTVLFIWISLSLGNILHVLMAPYIKEVVTFYVIFIEID